CLCLHTSSLRAFFLVGLRCLFHKRSIYYSIGQVLVNRCLPGEILDFKSSFCLSGGGESVHCCAWKPCTIIAYYNRTMATVGAILAYRRGRCGEPQLEKSVLSRLPPPPRAPMNKTP